MFRVSGREINLFLDSHCSIFAEENMYERACACVCLHHCMYSLRLERLCLTESVSVYKLGYDDELDYDTYVCLVSTGTRACVHMCERN